MISVFPPNEKLFADNGLKILKPLKAVIHKIDNGEYVLNLRDSLENLEFYQSGNILQTMTPWGKQAFRIKNTVIENKKINITAPHVYFDSENFIIADSFVVEKNCNAALAHLNAATDVPSPFTTISDIETISSYRCVRRSLAEAIAEVIDRWGGHIVRNNWHIEVRQKIGQDRGVTLAYGKNIIAIQAEENWDDVATKIMPVGKEGITLPEIWLSNTDEIYDIPYSKVIRFEQNDINQEGFKNSNGEFNETAYKAALIDNLRNQGLEYLEINKVPKVNYVLNAYLKDISDVGDIVYVKHPKCKIDLITNVISLDYDIISGRITKVEFGNFKNNLKNLIPAIDAKIDQKVETSAGETTAKLERELMEATKYIKDRFDSSYILYEPDRILVLDKIPKEEASNVIVINSGGIGFSKTGINGVFNSAWTIDGTMNLQHINVINLVADLIKGGTLRLGNNLNESGILELYDGSNTLICLMDKSGLKMFCKDGRTITLNADEGLVGYDPSGNEIYWADEDEFHMAKGAVQNELTVANKIRFIPITTDTNTGVGIVATA